MNVYQNTEFKGRDYESTNVVACEAESAPGPQWVVCDPQRLHYLEPLYTQAGVRYWGYL